MDELIYKRDAIKAICEDGTWLESQGCTEITMAERKQRDVDIIEDLPPVQPNHNAEVSKMVDDLINRQAAIDALDEQIEQCNKALGSFDISPKDEYAIKVERASLKAYKEQLENLPAVKPKNGTLIIPLNESDFKSVKRIMLDCAPWCRTFYEEGGEAHWILKYTPDDGEVYECDNCGVTWQFNDGGPEENEAFYCPKCGFKMGKGEADGTD